MNARFPVTRLRRLRRTEGMRQLVRETRLHPSMLVMPLFICEGQNVVEPIGSMPGQNRYSVDRAALEAAACHEQGIGGVLLFGIPAQKDTEGTEAFRDDGITQRAIRAIKEKSDIPIIADVCLCEYMSHGHCGIVCGESVDNDATLPLLARTAVSLARAGADIVAPSDMMDGRVAAIRSALDKEGFSEIPIMSYSAKHASAFYGPFRDAAGSAPGFGDRRGYQMDPANGQEAMREMEQDMIEGADMLLVKPALPCLDLIRQAADSFGVPLAAYQVSGEYSMIKAAAAANMLDERRAVLETMTALARAGAGILITYYAREVARWLKEESR